MHSNLENFKRKMTHLMKPGKHSAISNAESPTHSAYDEDRTSAVAAYEAALCLFREQSRGLPLNNPHKEREILDSIDSAYFSHCDFDSTVYELKRLPALLDVNEINAERDRKKNQLVVVSKKVSDLILHHHPSYSAELTKVTELQSTLLSAHSACRTARKVIDGARDHFTVAGLTILGKYRKRQRLLAVLEALKRLKTLKETDQRLRELFEEENYIGAIMMCTECQRAAASFRQYRCISDLSEKLSDTMVVIERQLDNALASMAVRTDLERYSRVLAAYEMIGKTKTAADSVVSHFSKAISNAVDSVIQKYHHMEGGDVGGPTSARDVPAERLIVCLRELLSIFWRIWRGYHALLVWHGERPVLASCDAGEDADERVDSDYVETRLEQGLARVWGESINQLTNVFRTGQLISLKMDDFLALIELANRTSAVGHRHFKSESVEMKETLREKSLEYLNHHHRRSLDELGMFLETEAWEAVPVERHFNYKDLPEYAFLTGSVDRGLRRRSENGSVDNADRVASWEPMTEDNCSLNPFEHSTGGTDADVRNGGRLESASESDDSDVPEELKQDFIDETAYENRAQRPVFKRHESFKLVDSMQPILSNAALSLLRLWGRYLQAACSLPSIAFDVVLLQAQLFDYYTFAINGYFGSDVVDYGVESTPTKLSHALKRMEGTLPEMGKEVPANMTAGGVLTYADRLFGLAQRVVAVESLIFAAKQLEKLRPMLESLVPANKAAFVSQFYSQTILVVPELRRSVYGAVGSKALNYVHFLTAVSSVNWEIGELMSQHSAYVDFLVKDLDNLRLRLSELARNVQIPREVCVILWEFCIQVITRLLVEGYSHAKKCTNEGRALMQLDFQQLLLVLEKVSDLRPLPHREYVENYIKAYYLPEASIEQWIMERKDYSPKQLMGLLNVATHVSRRTRQRLLSYLQGNPEDT